MQGRRDWENSTPTEGQASGQCRGVSADSQGQKSAQNKKCIHGIQVLFGLHVGMLTFVVLGCGRVN